MAVDDFYKEYEDKGVITGPIDYNDFELVNSKLRVKGSSIDLISKSTGRPLAISSIRSQQGGAALLRKIGLNPATRLSQKTTSALQNFDFRISQLNERANAIEMNKLPEIVEEVDTGVATLLNGVDTTDESEFTLRELRGLDKVMQAYRGELANNLGKLSELDKSIGAEETKLKELAEDNENRPAIEKNLRDMRTERDARLEVTSATSTAIRSQIPRIKDTISRILNGDTTLAEKSRHYSGNRE